MLKKKPTVKQNIPAWILLRHADKPHGYNPDGTANYEHFDPKITPTWIVIEGTLYGQEECSPAALQAANEHNEYYYNEHTCPTNWLPVAKLMHGTDDDPHGLFRHVQTIYVPTNAEIVAAFDAEETESSCGDADPRAYKLHELPYCVLQHFFTALRSDGDGDTIDGTAREVQSIPSTPVSAPNVFIGRDGNPRAAIDPVQHNAHVQGLRTAFQDHGVSQHTLSGYVSLGVRVETFEALVADYTQGKEYAFMSNKDPVVYHPQHGWYVVVVETDDIEPAVNQGIALNGDRPDWFTAEDWERLWLRWGGLPNMALHQLVNGVTPLPLMRWLEAIAQEH